jgi:hypothetical protein
LSLVPKNLSPFSYPNISYFEGLEEGKTVNPMNDMKCGKPNKMVKKS